MRAAVCVFARFCRRLQSVARGPTPALPRGESFKAPQFLEPLRDPATFCIWGHFIKSCHRATKQDPRTFQEVLALWLSIWFVRIAPVVLFLGFFLNFAHRADRCPLKNRRTAGHKWQGCARSWLLLPRLAVGDAWGGRVVV